MSPTIALIRAHLDYGKPHAIVNNRDKNNWAKSFRPTIFGVCLTFPSRRPLPSVAQTRHLRMPFLSLRFQAHPFDPVSSARDFQQLQLRNDECLDDRGQSLLCGASAISASSWAMRAAASFIHRAASLIHAKISLSECEWRLATPQMGQGMSLNAVTSPPPSRTPAQ
jgi:hypothetical protein